METAADVWRIKLLTRKNKEIDETRRKSNVDVIERKFSKVFSCTSCRYTKSKTCGSTEEGLMCKKPPPIPDHSFASLKQILSEDCSNCCGTVIEFFKEAFKTIQGYPKTRVCDILADMSDYLLAIASDCVLLLRRCFHCFMSAK
ncbi:uncharacterized protein LOC125074862 [Vanessa atalanta]|uniref:uncharacterized protein LOC125074862 n=1 Tax=Vanessa atalanta TaxID=42275 RepID=UPI001FCD7916|nr:uncharacterized protein LOC125074862 [Vanessa atalanta]